MNDKICIDCQKPLPLTYFRLNGNRHQSHCQECDKIRRTNYKLIRLPMLREKNLEKEWQKLFVEINKQCRVCHGVKSKLDNFEIRTDGLFSNACNDCDKIRCKKFWYENSDRLREKNLVLEMVVQDDKICDDCLITKPRNEFKIKETGKINNICNECQKIRWKKYNSNAKKTRRAREKNNRLNPLAKLKQNFSRGIRLALKSQNSSKRNKSFLQFLEYDMSQLKKHLENQFEDWMTWNNYGSEWQVDHIIPQSAFPYNNMMDLNFKILWSLENLRPLKSIDNLKKKNLIIPELRELVLKKLANRGIIFH